MNERTETLSDSKPKNDTKGRLISMLVLALSFGMSIIVLLAIVMGQILFGLFAKEQNIALKQMGKKLSDYIYETLNYLTFNSETRPFPYKSWDDSSEQPDLVTDLPAENS